MIEFKECKRYEGGTVCNKREEFSGKEQGRTPETYWVKSNRGDLGKRQGRVYDFSYQWKRRLE